MKVFIAGAAGFLGRETVFAALKRGWEVVAILHESPMFFPNTVRKIERDLSCDTALDDLILQEFPDAIVNCAAVTSIDAAEKNQDVAVRLNVNFPRRLAQLANHISARLVHVSTEMVFDGDAAPYGHTAMPAPKNFYAQTKLSGEVETLKYAHGNATIVRATLLSGNSPSGTKSLHEKLFCQWAAGTPTALFSDEIRQPVSVKNLAEVLVELCERPNLSGVYHWACGDRLSRYEIGVRIARRFGLDPEKWIRKISYADVPAALAEKRPRDLSLSLEPLPGKLKARVQAFDELLAEMDVPANCARWYEAETGLKVRRKLIKGVDF
ncbi:MAG: SDR family oxidoreductase [Opitutales bacterium]|nr:SDR family oxidoreductase [Opitutales bacterium]